MSQDPLVRAQDLHDGYRNRRVLDGIELSISGAITGLLGPNGAGKTTLLHLLCGLRRPSRGSLTVLGVDLSRRSAIRVLAPKIGFLPQNFGYLPGYSVRDFVTYAGWLKGMSGPDLTTAVNVAIEDVNLSDRASSKMRTLSGGMIRRVGIAAAVVHRPELVLLDEPAAGLDPAQRSDLRALLVRLAEHSAVVLSTHLIEDVRMVCTDVVVLNEGAIRFTGTPDELQSRACATSDAGDLEAGYLSVLTLAIDGDNG